MLVASGICALLYSQSFLQSIRIVRNSVPKSSLPPSDINSPTSEDETNDKFLSLIPALQPDKKSRIAETKVGNSFTIVGRIHHMEFLYVLSTVVTTTCF